MWILISCSSVLCVLMALGMFMFVKVMSSLISVMSTPPCLFKFFDFVYDAVYVDLKYYDVFVLWLSVVCAWCCCYNLCMMHLQSGLYCRFFYLCAIQMNPVCVCVEVCCFFIYLWQMSQIYMTGACLFVCVVGPVFDSTSPLLWGAEPAMRQGVTAGIGPPFLGTGLYWHNLYRCL